MDLTSPAVIRNICSQFGFTFKKSLGQNFLTSRETLDNIADAVGQDCGVIEIGPGFGTLTAALAERARRVTAIELDERLLDVLKFTLGGYDNIKIIHGDVMKLDLKQIIHKEFGGGKVSIAANLPYYITTPVITKLLEERLPVSNIVVMVQKEVARRLCAECGSKDCGAITVMCRYYTKPEIIADVPASLFVPPPKVDGAVLKMRMPDKPSVQVLDERMFFRTVKAAFSQRRKTLLNCLCSFFAIPKPELSDILVKLDIEPARRGETLSLEEFARLSDALYNRTA